jgi:hypothetical protein
MAGPEVPPREVAPCRPIVIPITITFTTITMTSLMVMLMDMNIITITRVGRRRVVADG